VAHHVAEGPSPPVVRERAEPPQQPGLGSPDVGRALQDAELAPLERAPDLVRARLRSHPDGRHVEALGEVADLSEDARVPPGLGDRDDANVSLRQAPALVRTAGS